MGTSLQWATVAVMIADPLPQRRRGPGGAQRQRAPGRGAPLDAPPDVLEGLRGFLERLPSDADGRATLALAPDGFFSLETAIGALRLALLRRYRDHQATGMLPTNGRFLWYELEGERVVDKARARGHPGVTGKGIDQTLTEALTDLRETGIVPWVDIPDETRSVADYRGHQTILDGLLAGLDRIGLDPWSAHGVLPPLILCESRSLAGVLQALAEEYRCLITSTNGQAAGHLHTQVAPLLPPLRDEAEAGATGPRRVLYLGDWDDQGGQIEANARRVLARYPGYDEGAWERVALTEVKVRDHRLTPIMKTDRRYKAKGPQPAVETEALGQELITGLLRERLVALLPVSLEAVRLREQAERKALLAALRREA
jgi:hypothetical protein